MRKMILATIGAFGLCANLMLSAEPAEASQPDISLTCTTEYNGNDYDIKVYMAERRMEINGVSRAIAEVRTDRIVSEPFKSEMSDQSRIYWTYTWTIFRSTLKFQLQSVLSFNNRERWDEGDCRKSSAQF